MLTEIKPVPYANVVLKLLDGVYNRKDAAEWSVLLNNQDAIRRNFRQYALELVVDPDRGFAYFRQFTEEDHEDAAKFYRLAKRHGIGFRTTMLCVLLRDALAAHEARRNFAQPLLISFDQMMQLMERYLGTKNGQVRKERLGDAVKGVIKLGYLSRVVGYKNQYEVHRILLVRLSEEVLSDLVSVLEDFLQSNGNEEGDYQDE